MFVMGLILLAASGGRASPYGINAHVPGSFELDVVQEAGIEWIRVDFLWSVVEKQKGVCDWSIYDRLFAGAEARSLEIYAIIHDTPAWATDDEPGRGVPRDLWDFSEFCYRAAARYRGRVRVWSLWNEPNLGRFWQGGRTEYIYSILLPGAHAIHRADPDALVAGPDLAHLSSAHWKNWLRDCLIAAGDELDIVSHHVYPSGSRASDVIEKLEEGGPNFWDDPSVREVLENRGWIDRPFWLTETGVNVERSGEEGQADFYDDLLEYYFDEDLTPEWLSAILFYHLTDDPAHPNEAWGILTAPPEYSPRPAYERYSEFISRTPVMDARTSVSSTPGLLIPEQWNRIELVVENLSGRTWFPEESICIGVQNLPDDWEVEGGCLEGELPSGSSVQLEMELRPPELSPRLPNVENLLRMRMKDGAGVFFGLPVTIRVFSGWRDIPVVLSGPVSRVVDEGADIVIGVITDRPEYSEYRWYRNGRPLNDGTVYSGSRSPSLEIFGVHAEYSGEYLCRIRRDGAWVDSSPARVLLSEELSPREGDGRATPDQRFHQGRRILP